MEYNNYFFETDYLHDGLNTTNNSMNTAIILSEEYSKQYQKNSTHLLTKFESLVKPKGICDSIAYSGDPVRMAKHLGAIRVLNERNTQK